MSKTQGHCNACSGERNHEILHEERTSWRDEEESVAGGDSYETLKCCGCDSVKLRHTSWFSEDDEPTITYFPPAISRRRPEWFRSLAGELGEGEDFVETLLNEIYVAVQNNLPSLATMGVRALLENIMISKAGDLGTFAKNISKFEELGHVSKLQRERLETILEAGHAAMHRAYQPTVRSMVTLLDITEHVIESIYLHDRKIAALRKSVPARVKAGAA